MEVEFADDMQVVHFDFNRYMITLNTHKRTFLKLSTGIDYGYFFASF